MPSEITPDTKITNVPTWRRVVALAIFAEILALGFDTPTAMFSVVCLAVLLSCLWYGTKANSNRVLLALSQLTIAMVLSVSAFYFLVNRDLGYSLLLSAVAFFWAASILFRDRFQTVVRATAAVGIALLSLGLIELLMPPGTSLVNTKKPNFPKEMWRVAGHRDFYDTKVPVLGWKPHPNETAKSWGLLSKSEEEWRVVYSTDDEGWRIVPGQPDSGPRIVLLGGSFTFGHALKNEESIAARMQQAMPDRRVENRGINAYGATQAMLTLEQMEDPDVQWVFYYMIDAHFPRISGEPYWVRSHPTVPLMHVNGQGELTPRKSIVLAWDGKLDKFFADRSVFYERLTNIRPWTMPQADQITVSEEIIKRLRDVAETKANPTPRYVTVLLPSLDITEQTERQLELTQRLKADNVTVIDFYGRLNEYLKANPERERRDMFDLTSNHPKAELAELFAQWTREYIASREKDQPTATASTTP